MGFRGHHYETNEPVAVRLENGVVASIESCEPCETILAPTFFDIQVNGAFGIDFTSAILTLDQIQTVQNALAKRGVGGFLATVITASFETQQSAVVTLAKAGLDIHLEGPYLSPQDGPRGAHPKEHIRNPDWQEFQKLQEAANGRIKLVTLAPEQPGAIELIRKLCAASVVVSIGHTAATPSQIREAVAAGATLSTHLGNGSHPLLPRHENYLWEQLACDELAASVIADGHHLPDSMLKVIARTKRNVILISDASPLAGQPPGRYQQWGADLIVEPSGRIGVANTPFLAGSGAFLDECVQYMMKATNVSWREAIQMASVNPRRLLGIPVPTLTLGVPWSFQALPRGGRL